MAVNLRGSRRLELLASGFELVEAPMPDGSGGLHFTDARTGDILHRDGGGDLIVVDRGRVCGGMVRHREGTVVYSGPTIAEKRPDGSWRNIFEIDERDGVLVTFNDIAALPDGTIVGGTLRWPPRPEGTRVAGDLSGPDAIDGELWRITSEGVAQVVYGPVGISNGVEVTPGGKTIYFADTRGRRILHLRVTSAEFEVLGEISTEEVGRPDGLAADADGHVWAAIMDGGAVAQFSASGDLLERVPIPARKVTSLAFEGTSSTRLFIGTGTLPDVDDQGGSIFVLDAGVRGAPVHRAMI